MFDEEKYKKAAAEVAKENATLPSIGPPQILQVSPACNKLKACGGGDLRTISFVLLIDFLLYNP